MNNKLTASLKSIDNPLQSSKDDMTRWMEGVNDKVFSYKPLNSPTVVSQTISVLHLRVLLQIYSTAPTTFTGIWALGNNYGNQYLQSPQAYKLQQIRDLNLRVNISFNQLANFALAPVPTGSYSVMYYVVFANQPQGLGTTDDWYLVLPFQFNYTHGANPSFSFSNPVQNFRLSNTIQGRPIVNTLGTGYPDFNSNATRITDTQYQRLLSQDVTMNVGGGFDLGQIDGTTYPNSTPNTPLTAANKAHFEYFLYGNAPAASNNTFFRIVPTAVFTYTGILADYVPLDN